MRPLLTHCYRPKKRQAISRGPKGKCASPLQKEKNKEGHMIVKRMPIALAISFALGQTA